MDEGWSLKKLHRLIMLSSTYRQSSQDRAEARAVDPENKWLWRMNRQRLDYESLRDSILLVSGQLDRTMGGLPYSFTALPTVPRRTVYAFVERGRLPVDLATFDFANPEAHVPQRNLTTTPQQALYLMNSPFLAEQVKHLIARPEIASARDDRARVEILYRIVFGRDPREQQVQLALDYLASERAVRDEKAARVGARPQSVWQYGMGSFDEKTRRVEFSPFTHFSTFPEQRWQPASLLPQPVIGSPSVRAKDGTPGDGPNHATIRRWVAPAGGIAAVNGTVAQKQPSERMYGDGIRARIVHSREGKLVEERVQNREAELSANVRVEPGDTIDFIVDSLTDAENDDFTWTPEVHLTAANGQDQPRIWNAAEEFYGPESPVLSSWERYAQVLLETNEFAFVD